MSSRLCSVSSEAVSQSGEAGVILPCQYHDLSGGGYRFTGEQRLMLALLADAINVYQKGALSRALRARRLYADAEQWIMTDRAGSLALAFPTVCEALGINAVRLRRRLLDWKHSLRHQHGDRSALQFQTPSQERRSLASREISNN
ncbi:MAG TPA: hypothetical protein VMF50_10660 [Candidatus Binataceae bacterium]|nr:hypothetical protein [Candidatus Binataceae bacterium]